MNQLPQDTLVHVLSFCPLPLLALCSVLNHEWYSFIHSDDDDEHNNSSSETSKAIWETIYKQITRDNYTNNNNNNNTVSKMKELIKNAITFKFVPVNADTQVDIVNNGKTITCSTVSPWKTFVTNSNINLKETHKDVHCWEAVLDSFNPSSLTTNYFSVVVGLFWNEIPSEHYIVGFESESIGYITGNRAIRLNNVYTPTEYTVGDYEFAREPDMIKSGDRIGVKVHISKDRTQCDVLLYLNGTKIVQVNGIEATCVKPAVSMVDNQTVSIRKVYDFPDDNSSEETKVLVINYKSI
jgi:hypothetical protein